MAAISFLWKHRAQFPFFSKANLRAWAKRVLTYKTLRKRNKTRNKLIKHGADISETAEIGAVKVDGPKKYLLIGHHSFLGKVEIALHEKVTIQNNVCINDGVILLTGSHQLTDPLWRHKKKPILIKDYAWIATGAIILPGVTIGKGAVVGAGAVVSKDIPDYAVVSGNPARILEVKRTSDLRYNPCEFLAENRAWLIG